MNLFLSWKFSGFISWQKISLTRLRSGKNSIINLGFILLNLVWWFCWQFIWFPTSLRIYLFYLMHKLLLNWYLIYHVMIHLFFTKVSDFFWEQHDLMMNIHRRNFYSEAKIYCAPQTSVNNSTNISVCECRNVIPGVEKFGFKVSWLVNRLSSCGFHNP